MFSVQFKTKDLFYRRCQLFGYIASLSVEALVELKDSSSQGPESVARRTVDILYTAPPVSVKAQGECQVEDGFRSQSSSLMMDDQSPPAGCPCRRHCQGDGTPAACRVSQHPVHTPNTQRVVSVNTQCTLRTHSVSCQSTHSTHSEHSFTTFFLQVQLWRKVPESDAGSECAPSSGGALEASTIHTR